MPADLHSSKDLDRRSTAERIGERLAEEIMGGALAPGASLRELELARRFGVARNTAREALRFVVDRGLAQHVVHQGARVVTLTETDVVELYQARRLLELSALPAAASAPAHRHDALDAAVSLVEEASVVEDPRAVDEAELAFHAAIVGLHDNARFDVFFADIGAGIRVCLAMTNRAEDVRSDPGELVAYHRTIREAIFDDPARARRLLGAHLDHYEEQMRRLVRTAAR